MNNIQPNASCKSDEKINTLSIAEKYKRYIGNKENDSTSIHLEYLETAETIARYLCFYIAVEPPQPNNMEIEMKDKDRRCDMMICDTGKRLCFKQINDYSKKKDWNNLEKDVCIKLKELQKKPIPEWMPWKPKNTILTDR